MNITQEKTGDLTAIVKIELGKEDYQESVSKTLKDHQRKAQMPGFRPGKVPFGLVKKMYGKAVMADEVNKLVSDSLGNYIRENNIEILGNPLPNEEKTPSFDFEEASDLTFYFDLGLTPEFDLEINDQIEMDYEKIAVEEEMIDKYLEDIRKRFGEQSNPEVSEENDTLKGQFSELDADGKLLEGGISNVATLSIEKVKLKTIKKKLTGLKVDDKAVFNPFRAIKDAQETAHLLNISEEEAKNLSSEFEFTVQEITRVETAELNEELFKKVYPSEEIKTIEELRERVKKEAATSFETETDKKFLSDVADKLIEISGIQLPDSFMKRWILETNSDKINAEQLEAQYENYSNSFKWQLIENKLIKKYEIQVTEDDVRKEYLKYFGFNPENTDEEAKKRIDSVVDSLMQNKEETKRLFDQLYDSRLLNLFKENIKLNEKEISYDDFVKLASEQKQ